MIGFGSTEKVFEDSEEDAIREFCEETYKAMGCDYITPEFTAQIKEFCESRGLELREKSDIYKISTDYPERYSYYYPSIANNATSVVVILRISHINRRHAMSPDGWAMMQVVRLVHFDCLYH